MFNITIKNMLKDKKVTISLIVGFLLSIAIVSSIPIYTRGILNNMLIDTFANYKADSTSNASSSSQSSDASSNSSSTTTTTATDSSSKNTTNTSSDNNSSDKADELYQKPELNYSENKGESSDSNKTYPAMLGVSYSTKVNSNYQNFISNYTQLKKNFDKETSKIDAPIAAKKNTITLQGMDFNYKTKSNTDEDAECDMVGISDITKHIDIIKGEMPKESIDSEKIADVLVDQNTYDNLNMEIGKTYEITSYGNDHPLKIKVAAVFQEKNDKFWSAKDTNNFYGKLVVSEKELLNILKTDEFYFKYFKDMNLRIDYDYNSMQSSKADAINSNLPNIIHELNANTNTIQVKCTLNACLDKYAKNESLYVTLIWIFTLPIIIIILFYVYVVSGFVVDSDKDQIALFKSRGIGIFEILRIYLYEGFMICALGIVIGPLIGYYICKAISYITGFLEFDAASKPIKFLISMNSYLYAIMTAAVMLATLLVSAYFASKSSIVEAKRSRNKYLMSILTNKNLDIVLLGVSIYGYYVYSKGNSNMFSKSGDVPVDPLLYLLSTVFIIGFGMFALRIYKYVTKLLFLIGNRLSGTSFYLAIINVLRYHLVKNVIMLFVIMTIAIGIFDIKIAKNINLSNENTVKYSVGADMTIQQYWSSTVDTEYATGDEENDNGTRYIYNEPSQAGLKNVKGVEAYTKVLNAKNQGDVKTKNGTTLITSIQGIKPYEFGKIAWFDSNLLNYNWYYYLNAMTKNRSYVIISSGLSKASGINKGDTISYKLGNGLYVNGTVMEIVDYWPGYQNLSTDKLVIGNFDYIFSKVSIYPYEVWIKKDGKTSNKDIYDSMRKQNLNIIGYKDTSIEFHEAKENAFLKATNAILSLGIISLTIVTVIAFVLYWVNSLKNRKLSFGVYRSLGINSKKVSLILIIEQILTLGASVLIGIINGNAACDLFLPLITGMWKSGSFSLPVNYISYIDEYLSFGSILAIVFICSLIILIRYISKLKINEAIKLGED